MLRVDSGYSRSLLLLKLVLLRRFRAFAILSALICNGDSWLAGVGEIT
jgi:hypothetical protein